MTAGNRPQTEPGKKRSMEGLPCPGLRAAGALRSAVIWTEVLGKPLALRRKR